MQAAGLHPGPTALHYRSAQHSLVPKSLGPGLQHLVLGSSNDPTQKRQWGPLAADRVHRLRCASRDADSGPLGHNTTYTPSPDVAAAMQQQFSFVVDTPTSTSTSSSSSSIGHAETAKPPRAKASKQQQHHQHHHHSAPPGSVRKSVHASPPQPASHQDDATWSTDPPGIVQVGPMGLDEPAASPAAPQVDPAILLAGQLAQAPSSQPAATNGNKHGPHNSDAGSTQEAGSTPVTPAIGSLTANTSNTTSTATNSMEQGADSTAESKSVRGGSSKVMQHGNANGNGNNRSVAGEVEAALLRAEEALTRAESSLEGIEQLPSARPASKLQQLFGVCRTAVIIGAISVGLVMSHAFNLYVQWAGAIATAAGIALWGYSRSALSQSGALAAFAVGCGTLGCSLRFGITLVAFFFSSSKLTQFRDEIKRQLDDAAKAGGQRDWMQVMCNGAIPTAIAIAYGVLAGCVDVPLGPSLRMEPWRAKLTTMLGAGFMGYYAACCGDTWASELGPLSKDTPRLITTMRPVRKGTNGGVTLLGLSASILGGAFVGAVFYAAALVSPTLWVFEGQQATAAAQWRLIPLGLMAGLLGSVIDSVLGATLQYTGYNRATGRVTSTPGPEVVHISGRPVLTNNLVNFLSTTMTAGLTALAALKVFGC